MNYLLDSDAVTFLYDDHRQPHHQAILDRITRLENQDSLQTSVLVMCELEYSFFNAPDDKQLRIRNTIDSINSHFDTIVPLEADVPIVYGELKARLRNERQLDRQQMRRHNIDLLLASSAICTSSILIGMDRLYRDLARFRQDFKYENWLEA